TGAKLSSVVESMTNETTAPGAGPRSVATACGVITPLIGAVGLTGWLASGATHKMLLPGFASMDTAIGLFLAGLALLLLADEEVRPGWWRVAVACAALVMLLGLLRIGEYVFATELSIDQLLIQDVSEGTTVDSLRMGVGTALCFGLT